MSDGASDIRRNTFVVGAANLLSRLTGLAREVVFAAVFGAGVQADAYNAAFRIGNMLRELFAEGALSNAFVPLFADVDEKSGQSSAFALANAFLGVLLFAVGLVTIATFLLAEPLVHLVADGFAADAAKFELTATLTRLLSPFVATISVASVFMGILNVRGRFFLPAVCPALFNFAIITACLVAEPFREATGLDPIMAVAVAALVGGALQAGLQLPSLHRQGFKLRPTFGKHPDLKRLLAFVGPAVIAISVTQIHLLVETRIASGQGDGPVSWLLYSFRIAHLPFSIVSGAVGVAALAGLSVLAAQDRWDDFKRALADALNLNSYLLVPAAVGLFILAEPITALFFERGAFTAHDTAQTGLMLQMYAVALLAIGAQRILVPMFYTLEDPWTPMWAGLATVAVKWPLAVWLVEQIGVRGLPLSHAILATIEVGLLVALLHRRVGGFLRRMLGFHARVFGAAAVMGGLVYAGSALVNGTLSLLIACAVGAVVYLGVSDVLGLKEGRKVVGRFLRLRPQGLPPTVDEETRRLLDRLNGAPQTEVELVDGRAWVRTAEFSVVVQATGGVLACDEHLAEQGLKKLRRVQVQAVMRVGGGPPQLHGLLLGEVAIKADGDQVVLGMAVGPVLPVDEG